jgi:hypothetical protein
VEIDKDDDFVIRHNSAVVFVSVIPGFGEGGVVIRVRSPLVAKVPITYDLCRWIAVEGQNYLLGRAWLVPNEGGADGWVFFGHAITADDLDESELMDAIYAVTYTSDNLDNDLRDRFGGDLFGPES